MSYLNKKICWVLETTIRIQLRKRFTTQTAFKPQYAARFVNITSFNWIRIVNVSTKDSSNEEPKNNGDKWIMVTKKKNIDHAIDSHSIVIALGYDIPPLCGKFVEQQRRLKRWQCKLIGETINNKISFSCKFLHENLPKQQSFQRK